MVLWRIVNIAPVGKKEASQKAGIFCLHKTPAGALILEDIMNSEQILVDNCPECESHKTELGTLMVIKESVNNNFAELCESSKVTLIKMWFEQWKLDKRTEQIQSYKKVNIKSINRG